MEVTVPNTLNVLNGSDACLSLHLQLLLHREPQTVLPELDLPGV